MRPRLPLHTNTNQQCARTDVHTITQLHMFSKPNYNTRSTSRFVEVDTFCAIFWQKIFGAHNAHASMWYLQASHTIAFMFNTLWWRKSKIWHRPNTFQSQHLFLDTFCHFWFEIHCCKYDNKAWFTTSLSGLYNYRFGFQTFKASLILDARCARGSHELPYFDASFICTQPGLKQQTFSRRETENLPKGLKE